LMPERPMGGPDVFIVNASDDPDLTGLWASRLRRSTFDRAKRCIVERGLRVEYSYKTTKNIGKLLQEAAAADACYCLILAPDELGRNVVKWRNMQTRTETEWPISQAETLIRAACGGGVS
jgi:histidyl-tRNA synthetase